MMKKIAVLLFGLLYMSSALAISEDEPLSPEEAFSVQGRVIDENTVEVEWRVAEGYYLYHDKIHFTSQTPGIELGSIELPAGKKKYDEIFKKELETHRHTLTVRVPLQRTDSSVNTLQLIAGSQGCADIGLCYPPQKQAILLSLPTITAAAGKPAGLQKLKSLGNSLGLGGAQEFLPPDEAFSFDAHMSDNGTIVADWQIAEGYYLYRNKFAFSSDSAGVALGNAVMPAGQMHTGILPDGTEGEVEVYMDGVQISVPVQRTDAGANTVNFIASFQGCADAGICYPPMTKSVSFDLPATTLAAAPAAIEKVAESDEDKTTYLGYILAAFGIGLLLTFTPCVLPMIPILSSIIVGQSTGGEITKLKGGMLSLSYVLGTSVVYSAAGWAAGASGKQLQAYFQNAWVIGTVSVILVLLALSMFGLFTIQMPTSIQSRLQSKSSGIQGGSLFGVFVMGILSSMIVGACASPVLLSVLGVAIKSQDPLLGALIMFAMSLGMGVILIAIGVGAGFLIPKAGTWMDSVKYFFGVLLIGVAIYILTVLPAVPVLLLWGVFFITVGVYLGATQSLPEGTSGWRVLWKGIGTVLLIWGVLNLLGGIQGNRDFLRPIDLSAISMGGPGGQQATVTSAHELFRQVSSPAELEREMAAARAAGKPVMIDFFATWCTDCLRMEKSTFADPQVQKLMQQFVALQVDVTDPDNPETSAVQKQLGVFAPPAILFFHADGSANETMNFYGYKDIDEFSAHLQQALNR
jgi:thiol:disulfide interchange protein DsbD